MNICNFEGSNVQAAGRVGGATGEAELRLTGSTATIVVFEIAVVAGLS